MTDDGNLKVWIMIAVSAAVVFLMFYHYQDWEVVWITIVSLLSFIGLGVLFLLSVGKWWSLCRLVFKQTEEANSWIQKIEAGLEEANNENARNRRSYDQLENSIRELQESHDALIEQLYKSEPLREIKNLDDLEIAKRKLIRF